MPESSASILKRFPRRASADRGLSGDYRRLLARLGDPQNKIPPVIHVAGTNGKGSTCAFLRAMVETAGLKAHVYTSPHLVKVHERIRLAGQLIGEEGLAGALAECEKALGSDTITFFEMMATAAFLVMARHPADVTILEVGMGGRLDFTNVIARSAATVITRLSYDHRPWLGDSMAQIAREKAGIMRRGIPCALAPQPSDEALTSVRQAAAALDVPLLVGGVDWDIESLPDNGFRFSSRRRTIDLPAPALVGAHQFSNAGLAIAALETLPLAIPDAALRQAMASVNWPARLQQIQSGPLADRLPSGWELWLDGGHNDSAGEVLSAQMAAWQREDGSRKRPLHVIIGMVTTKVPQEFLIPLIPHVDRACAVAITHEPLSYPAPTLAAILQSLGLQNASAADDLLQAFAELTPSSAPPGRLLIAGSLYLAGEVLRRNASPPC